ncbi:TonB-dependent receptor plug domain-containing protein [Aquabacterium sp. UBA2148]|uniref:TonB-dependent receptor plug domain-containing protein n=1 Tax=Aquabacterium sp. UBA2148 TaxID=1946042 RepID=UPI00257A789B|nr:TonB-dependent receptor plug domain-containing protein [Aquabacterium sp. UBA2148]
MKSIPVARLSLSALSCLALQAWSPSALADESVPEVVVTATRAPVDRARVLADVSVITREDIDRSGAMDLADLLDRQPGLTFSNNGGPGTYTDVFVRGANARFTALLVDGLRVDSQNLQGGAVWQGTRCRRSIASRWCAEPAAPCMALTPSAA